MCYIIWAPSSEFVSSSIPSWQILTAHAQPFRGARDLAFCLKVPLDSLLVWASSEGAGETARMRRLAWTFADRIGDMYQIRLTRSILPSFVRQVIRKMRSFLQILLMHALQHRSYYDTFILKLWIRTSCYIIQLLPFFFALGNIILEGEQIVMLPSHNGNNCFIMPINIFSLQCETKRILINTVFISFAIKLLRVFL